MTSPWVDGQGVNAADMYAYIEQRLDVLDSDTGVQTNLAGLVTNVSGGGQNAAGFIRRAGGVVILFLTFDLATGITVPSDGNVTNKPLLKVAANYTPSVSGQPLTSTTVGPAVNYYIDSSGQINIASTVPGASLAGGTTLSVGGNFYL